MNAISERTPILFLAWGSPWPAHSGASLRSLGLLRELSKAFDVQLVVASRQHLSREQRVELQKYACSVIDMQLLDQHWADRLSVLRLSLSRKLPYHSALLRYSISQRPDVVRYIQQFPGLVFTSIGHWGTLIHNHSGPHWILNQCDADVEFWRVYASQASNRLIQQVALVNLRLSQCHFPDIYKQVGQIISVCEEDLRLTQAIAPRTPIAIIENGVDCSFYVPNRQEHEDIPRLLFTGTSVARNMKALHQFTRATLPLIRQEIPEVELLVAGNFSKEAQNEFKTCPGISFTGRVDDIRPYFNKSDVFVAPFKEAHGSKLKVAEAMAMGMAIVSTEQGIRGLPAIDGVSACIARNNQEFAQRTVQLLKDPAGRSRLGATARLVALRQFDWTVLGDRLRAIVRTVEERLVA